MAEVASSPVAGRRRPTMADVGRLAGVSPTTVSFVINNRVNSGISPETRQLVLEAVELLGYRPNRAAQGLRTRRTHTIGLVTDRVGVTPHGGRTISGAHDVAQEHGSLLLIVNSNPRVVIAAVDDLLDRQVDGIVFAAEGTKRMTPPEAARQVPSVLVNCFAPRNTVPCVLPDEKRGGREATELLIAAGHRTIAHITGARAAWATRERIKGYYAALADAGIPRDDQLVLTGHFRTDSGYELTRALLARRDLPTAIFCGNDRMAMGAYQAMAEAGLRVPEDMSIVGYDDQEDLAAELRPPLSTLRLPYYEMGRWALEQIFAGAVPTLPPRTYLPCPVVTRGSVAYPRGLLYRFSIADVIDS
jgi:LacI family transcriptional regulator